MRKIFIVLCILLISISFLLFHDKGNNFLKPYLSSYLERKLTTGLNIKVVDLKIDLNHLQFNAKINELTHLKAQGKFSLFSQTLDLNYTLKSDDLKNKELSFKHKTNIKGTVSGTLNNMDIQGAGEIVKSNINYTFNVKDDLFNHIKIKINKADIASLLQLTAQAPYARGKVDVNIDIENLEQQSINNNPQIVLHKTILNQKIFKQKLKIDLPERTIITAKLNTKVSNKFFQINGIIQSTLASINLSNTYYNMKTKELSLDYKLLIPRLSKIITEHKQKLRGKLQIKGTFQSKNGKSHLTGKSKDLGGRVVFELKENKLNAHMNDVDIQKLLLLFGEKPYATGRFIANLQLNNLKELEGNFNFETKDSKSINYRLQKELNLNFGKDMPFSLNAKGTIRPKVISMEANLNSDIFQYSSSDIKYHLPNKTLNSTYLLHIPKLSKLNSLTGKTLKGELSINGELTHKNEILITGNTKDLGGNIDFIFKTKKLHAKMNHVSVEKLMQVLSYPQLFKANLVGMLDYNLATSSGKFRSTLNKAELLNSYLIQVIKTIKGDQLNSERYHKTHFNATLNKNLIDIDFKAQSENVLLLIPSGQINKISNKINAYYKVKVENKNLEGRIRGDIANPKITLDSSKYIQDNMMSMIQENMNKGRMGDFGMGKKESNAMKSMMNSFFR